MCKLSFLTLVTFCGLFQALVASGRTWPTLTGQTPLIIAHRGASGYRPEHTLAAYQLAMEMGADFIEPDLVSTKDGELVARHEPNIIDTTDVLKHPEFQNRRRQKLVDGKPMDGFFTEDFTLAELKTLRAIQSRPIRDPSFNGQFAIPTFTEILTLVRAFEQSSGRLVGIYPETKHPTYFRAMGLPLEEKLLDTLITFGFVDPKRVFIQSFEVSNLETILPALMGKKRIKLPLIQLFGKGSEQPYDFVVAGRLETYQDLLKAETLRSRIAIYAKGIGVWKNSFILRETLPLPSDLNGDGQAEAIEKLTGQILPLVSNGHAAGLLIHVYTLRNEEIFQALGYTTPQAEYKDLLRLGVDGIFTDFADTGVRARQNTDDQQPILFSPTVPGKNRN